MDITIVTGRDKPLFIPLQWDPAATGDPANLVPLPIENTVIALNILGKTYNTSQPGSSLSTNATMSLATIDTSSMLEPDGVYAAELVMYNAQYPGGYTIAGPSQAEEVTVTIVDPINGDPQSLPGLTVPVISLIGSSEDVALLGGTYADPGVTAYDGTYGDISADVVVTGTVDTSIAGTYTLSYDVTNADGQIAATVTRDVYVGVSKDIEYKNLVFTVAYTNGCTENYNVRWHS